MGRPGITEETCSPSIEIYEFGESCWANVPKIAIAETGIPKEDVEWVSVVLAEVGLQFQGDQLVVDLPEIIDVTAIAILAGIELICARARILTQNSSR